MSDPAFWDDVDKARDISQKATEAKDAYETYTRLFSRIEALQDILDLAVEEDDESMEGEIQGELDAAGCYRKKGNGNPPERRV